MNKINVYPIKSILHDEEYIENKRNNLFNELSKLTGYSFYISSLDSLYKTKLSLILIESGGSENEFLKVINNLKEPFIFLTFGTNNSLAASLEILTYLKRNSLKGEILHGDFSFIANRIKELIKENIYD